MALDQHSVLEWVLVILALVAFGLATVSASSNVKTRSINLTALGLFLLTLTLVVT